MDRSWQAVLLFGGLLVAAAVSAQETDRLRHFEEHGVMDPQVSSETANSLVRAGIESGDPEVVDLAIRGLGNLAAVLAHDLPHVYAELPTRTFHGVPGLKRFLMEHWLEQLDQARGSAFEATNESLGCDSPDGITVTCPSPGEWGLEVNDSGDAVDPEALIRELSKRMPSWPMIPQILSVYWPGDPEVEQFLYQMRDTDRTPNVTLTTLSLLNVGKFTSEVANAFRMSQLEDPYTGDMEVGASPAVILAVDGLALSRPVESLSALIEAGVKYPAARGAALVAVAGYGEDLLQRHGRQIGRLVRSGAGAARTDAEAEAYDRLVGLLEVTAQ